MEDDRDPERDAYASFLSTRRRAVELTEEGRPGRLGPPQRNHGNETRTKITQQDFRGGGGVIGTVTRVCYGQYEGRRACIVAFNFLFLWKRFQDRLTHAEIEITFGSYQKKLGDPKSPTPEPVVRNVAPGRINGFPNADGRKWSFTTEKQCVVSLQTQISSSIPVRSDLKAFDESHRMEITGQRWSDSRKRGFHKACLVLDEIGTPKIGIIDETNVVVLLECDGDFQADVVVEVQLPWRKKLMGFPWPADEPLLFVDHGVTTPIGRPLNTLNFEALSDQDWKEALSGNEISSSDITTVPEVQTLATSHVENYKLYRVQGIHTQYDPSSVGTFLQDILKDNERSLDIELRTLTLDARSEGTKVAIISSSKLHKRLGPGEHWDYPVPAPVQSTLISRKQAVAFDINFGDFTVLSSPNDDPEFDIIALSGLGAHSFGSFKDRGGTYMWLADDLIFDFPRARVMTYGYESALLNSQSFQTLEDLAATLMSSLKTMRRNLLGSKTPRPIIFIGHSLGGLVLKEALIQMIDGDALDQANARSTQGILLFGVPNLGMNITPLLGKVSGQTNEPFLHFLRLDSDRLRRLNREFREKFTYKTCKMVSFYETELSPTAKKGPDGWKMDGEPAVMVTQDSATGGSRSWETGSKYAHPLKKNHSNLVKFYPRDPCYLHVKDILAELMENSETLKE